jgi:hypothetical protein
VVRIHSPRPPFLCRFIEVPELRFSDSQLKFRKCAQNCAHPAHFARAPLLPGPCVPAGERIGES